MKNPGHRGNRKSTADGASPFEAESAGDLDEPKTQCVALLGMFQEGKSLLINCLLRRPVALVGDGTATTPFPVAYSFADSESVALRDQSGIIRKKFSAVEEFMSFLREKSKTSQGKAEVRRWHEARVKLNSPCLKRVTLIDLPGFDGRPEDDAKSIKALQAVDLGVLIKSNRKSLQDNAILSRMLSPLAAHRIPTTVVVNCMLEGKRTLALPEGKENDRLAKEDHSRLENRLSNIYLPSGDGALLRINTALAWIGVGDGKLCGDNERAWREEADRLLNPANPAVCYARSNLALLESALFPEDLWLLGESLYSKALLRRAFRAWHTRASAIGSEFVLGREFGDST